MSDLKSKVQGMEPSITARDIKHLVKDSNNVYEALAVAALRSNQLAVKLKNELHQKLEEFASSSDAIEEISENKEQIEISKFYERLPNPAVIALEEYMNDELHYRFAKRHDDNRD